jgi:hypothetical protein
MQCSNPLLTKAVIGNIIVSKGKFLQFKFTRSENKTAHLWVAIFFISWIYILFFFVIENQNTPSGQNPLNIYGNAILDTITNNLYM